jgi:hypothetical protein
VYYDPKDPSRNLLEDFAEKSKRDVSFGSICAVGICIVFISILIAKFKHSQGPANREQET